MKIICYKNKLTEALNIVSKAVASKSTIFILQCILIDCNNGNIKFTANDMEFAIETEIEGTIKEKGVVALNAEIFNSIIRNLPDSEVTIYTDEDYNTYISCEKSKFKIEGISGDDFTPIPEYSKDNPIKLSKFLIKDIIKKTIFSIAVNDPNKTMNSELFEVKGNKLRVASLDGHRISIRNIEIEDYSNDIRIVIPGKCLNELSKIIEANEDEVEIYIDEKYIIFEFDDTKVLSRLVEGEFINFDQMIYSNYNTKVEINRNNLLDCINRASIFIKEGNKKPIIANIKENNMEIRCNSSIGFLNENIDINKEGDDILIGLNPKFLSDIMRVLDEDSISMYFCDSKSPCFIRDENNSYIYLVLPINFSNY